LLITIIQTANNTITKPIIIIIIIVNYKKLEIKIKQNKIKSIIQCINYAYYIYCNNN